MSEITEKLDISEFNIDTKKNMEIRTNVVVIGLGATGSSFLLLLGHFLKYYPRYNIRLYDFDHITNDNYEVSMYGFFANFQLEPNHRSKAMTGFRLLSRLSGIGKYRVTSNDKNNKIHYSVDQVDMSTLERDYKGKNELDYIFIFTDNNESRYEVAKYHQKYPHTKVFDCRVGSYSEFEVYYSDNPEKYMKTIYFNDDNTPKYIVTNNVCLDARMNFTIAMSSSSLLMNLFIQHLRGDITEDFKHVMMGKDYIGEIKGY